MKTAPQQTTTNATSPTAEAPQDGWQKQLAQVENNSKEAAAQRAFITGANDSPRMTAQRQRIESYTGNGRQMAEPARSTSQTIQQKAISRPKKFDDEENPQDTVQPVMEKISVQRKSGTEAKAPNATGLPDNLKSGIEALSGLSMDNVKVHYNSSQPAQLNALAYARGTDIHVAPGQEQHLPHEAWHVVQQAQGRVQPTVQMKNEPLINDDQALEDEADEMGELAAQTKGGMRDGRPDTNNALNSETSSVDGGISLAPQNPNILQRYADECKGDFLYQFTGTINADPPSDHNNKVPRAYYSSIPSGKDPGGVKVNGENGQPLPLTAGTEIDVGQSRIQGLWRAVCILPPGRKNHEIVWVPSAYITDPREPAKPVKQEEPTTKKTQPATKPSSAPNRLLSKGVSLELDMNGSLKSFELHLSMNSISGTELGLNFKHISGSKTYNPRISLDSIDLADAYLYFSGSTDGIHPLEIQIAGHSKADQDKTDVFKLFIVPSNTPGKYGIVSGNEFNASAIVWFDLGVSTGFSDTGPKIITERQHPVKEGGAYRFDYAVGPGGKINASLFIIKAPDNSDSILCYFSADPLTPTATGIQSEPSKRMTLAIPVPFEQLDIEKSGESNGSIAYRFLPPEHKKGMLVTYEMKSLGSSNIDPNTAVHGLNVYPLDTDAGSPQSTAPAAKDRFKLKNGLWQYGAEDRTTENFRIESAKDAHAKLAATTLPNNEPVLLLNEMSMLVMVASKENLTSAKVYEQWMELSYNIGLHGDAAAKGDEAAKQSLNALADKFIDLLIGEIGAKGTESTRSASGVGPAGGPITTATANKYTGASSTTTEWVGIGLKPSSTNVTVKPFENVRTLLKANNFADALSTLRSSYYLWVQDQLLSNNNSDKATKEKLQAYGYQLSYRSQLRETLSAQKKPLQKVKALYYPDLSNITDESGKKRTAGSEIKSIPLDIYYQDTEKEWVVYNFTTLTQPGKLNDFKRTWAKQPGEFAPPQEMFDLLSYDNGIGTGYINYQTLTGEGGVVRIEHPWTVGDVVLTAAAVLGLIALALTGVGLFLEAGTATAVGVAGAATVLGDIAAIGVAAGASIKLGQDIVQGAPIGGAQIGALAVDIAVALLPAVRGLRGIASLKQYKNAYILLDNISNASLLAKLNAGANVTAIITASANGVDELSALSKAHAEGKIDEATFYWGILRNVGLGAINIVLLHSTVKGLKGKAGVDEAPKLSGERPTVPPQEPAPSEPPKKEPPVPPPGTAPSEPKIPAGRPRPAHSIAPPVDASGSIDFAAWEARLRAKGIKGLPDSELVKKITEAGAGNKDSQAELRLAERYADAGYKVEIVRPKAETPAGDTPVIDEPLSPDLRIQLPGETTAARVDVKFREPGKPITKNNLNSRINHANDQIRQSHEGHGDIISDCSEAGPGGLDRTGIENYLNGKMSGNRTDPNARLSNVDYLEIIYRDGPVLKRSFMVRTADGNVNGPYTEVIK